MYKTLRLYLGQSIFTSIALVWFYVCNCPELECKTHFSIVKVHRFHETNVKYVVITYTEGSKYNLNEFCRMSNVQGSSVLVVSQVTLVGKPSH